MGGTVSTYINHTFFLELPISLQLLFPAGPSSDVVAQLREKHLKNSKEVHNVQHFLYVKMEHMQIFISNWYRCVSSYGSAAITPNQVVLLL